MARIKLQRSESANQNESILSGLLADLGDVLKSGYLAEGMPADMGR